MKIKLNKKKLKSLSPDVLTLSKNVTPNVAGGAHTDWDGCTTGVENTAFNCNSDRVCYNTGVDGCDNTYLCGASNGCQSGFGPTCVGKLCG